MLDEKTKIWLTDLLADRVRFDEPMARHTWLRVGGPADALAEPERVDQLIELVRRASDAGVPFQVVGDGANLLVLDGGVEGILVRLRRCLNRVAATELSGNQVLVTAMAGARLQALCRFAAERGLEGMNFAVGIPGTVGGAVSMNAGTSKGCMGDVLAELTILSPDGAARVVRREMLRMEYRRFSVKGERESVPLILGGNFRLRRGDAGRIQKEAARLLEQRRQRQPLSAASAGCFFKNPAGGPSAGALIERAGLKGFKIGGAEVSSIHANFIVNSGGASAAEILRLRDVVRQAVNDRFQVNLEEEVQIVGK